MLSQPIDPLIEQIIRERLRERRLPRDAAQIISVSTGGGLPCAGCGRIIGQRDQQWECEIAAGRLHFHQVCYMVWEDERDRE